MKEGMIMRRNTIAKILVIIFIFIGLTATIAYGEYICGDVNGDEDLNVSDAVYLINYVFVFGSPAPNPDCCETGCPQTITDIDGNTYFTIEVGDQCWMAQNLKVTHYSNGDPIPEVTDNGEWAGLSTGACCAYVNDESNATVYGRLYNWDAVIDARNIAPEGWHVPTDEEWKQMEMYLGMSQADADALNWRGTDEGGKLKEFGIAHWDSPNTGATNESGFTALPAGYRSAYGGYNDMGSDARFWSTTPYSSDGGYYRWLECTNSQSYRMGILQGCGLSVRCVKDQ
jgi:uncharacterized protein (TIGR02145 family)